MQSDQWTANGRRCGRCKKIFGRKTEMAGVGPNLRHDLRLFERLHLIPKSGGLLPFGCRRRSDLTLRVELCPIRQSFRHVLAL